MTHEHILDFILALDFVGLLFCAFMMYRTTRVGNFRRQLIDKLFLEARNDALNGREWRWREKAFEEVSFGDMTTHFWRPLKAELWWDSVAFLQPPAAPQEATK